MPECCGTCKCFCSSTGDDKRTRCCFGEAAPPLKSTPLETKLATFDAHSARAVRELIDWLVDRGDEVIAVARGRHVHGHYLYADAQLSGVRRRPLGSGDAGRTRGRGGVPDPYDPPSRQPNLVTHCYARLPCLCGWGRRFRLWRLACLPSVDAELG